MALTRILRNGSHVGALEAKADRALRQWWSGLADERVANSVTGLLADLHSKSQWIACDCMGEHSEKPVLAPARNDKTVYLRRLPHRPEHHRSCLFWFEQVKSVSETPSGSSGSGELGEPPSFVTDGGDAAVSIRNVPDRKATPDHSRTASIPKLARRLFWLAETSHWQHAPQTKLPIPSLLETAETLVIAPALNLKQILFCNPRVWSQRWANSAFIRCKNAGQSPICYWVQLAVGYDTVRRTVTFLNEDDRPMVIEVAGSMTVFGGDTSSVRFPMLVIAQIAQLSEGSTVLASAYAHPVASEQRWMLVDSDLERYTLEDLIHICQELRDNTGVEIEIAKPLFAWNGSGERPDFVLAIRGPKNRLSHMIVETMGYNDSDYETRKLDLAGNVKCPVYFDHRNATRAAGFGALKIAVVQWAKSLHPEI